MRAGRLDTRVTIQSRTLTQDSAGAPVEQWSDFRTVWAEVTEQRGAEFMAGRIVQTQASRQVILRLHYIAGVNETMRVICRGRTLQITSVVQVGRKSGLELTCEAVNG